MKVMIKAFAVAAALLALTACVSSEYKALVDYRKAKLDEPLTIPEGYNGNRIVDYYPIPPVKVGLVDVDAETPTPPALSLADEGNLVKIQRLSGESWILVKLSPGQVWPLVGQYASRAGIVITREQARQGFMETGWLNKEEDASLREKYRFVVRQGVQRNSTEVLVMQYEELNDLPDRIVEWNSSVVDANSADKTLRNLAEFMASYADPTAAVSLRAQNIDTSSRIYLKQDGQVPRVMVKIDQEKGFASAQYAVENSGFSVNDINYSEGKIFATPKVDEDKEIGFFSRLRGKTSKTFWPEDTYEFILTPSAEKGWWQFTVRSQESLERSEVKDILKEVKRNFT